MVREIPESEVATMRALVKCAVVMISIALAYSIVFEVRTAFRTSLTLNARMAAVRSKALRDTSIKIDKIVDRYRINTN